jgi:hypothetical protein
MARARRRQRRVRVSERYLGVRVGRVTVAIRRRPGWQGGAATATAFAKNLNAAHELGRQIRDGLYPDRAWWPSASWYSAWRAADAVLTPTLSDGRLARTPSFLSPATARRFEIFSARHPITFATTDRGAPIVAGDDARADIVLMLYEFFENRARDRLKRCLRCSRWFADETKNRAQRWCSEGCHRRAWNRAARRAAEHAQYTKKTRTKRGRHR